MNTPRLLRILFISLLLLPVAASTVFTQQASTTAAPSHPSQAAQSSNDAPAPPSDSAATQSASSSVTPAADVMSSAPSREQDDRLTFMQESRSEVEPAPSAGGLLMRTFGALLIIVGLIVGVGYGLRRFGGARFGASETDSPNLKVISSVALGERRSLAVVRFGSRTLLVGSTPQSLTLLASEDDDLDSSALPARSVADLLRNETSSRASFSDELLLADQHQDSSEQNRPLNTPAQSTLAQYQPQTARGEF